MVCLRLQQQKLINESRYLWRIFDEINKRPEVVIEHVL